METPNNPWPTPPMKDDRYSLNKPYTPKANSAPSSARHSDARPSANNGGSDWNHYGPIEGDGSGGGSRGSHPRGSHHRKSKGGPSMALQIPLLLMALLAVVFSGFAFFRANQTYVTLNEALETGGLAGVAQVAIPSQPSVAPEPVAFAEVEVADSDPSFGPADAPVTFVEFSDFECPFCARFSPTVHQVLDEYGDQVRFVYKHFPLSIHSNAEPAAVAAQCAYNLGGAETFMSYHDRLFENTASLNDGLYKQLASDNGLDTAAFETCLTDGEALAKVQQDFQDGIAAGVQGTPSSFINGQQVGGAVPFEQVKAIIDAELN